MFNVTNNNVKALSRTSVNHEVILTLSHSHSLQRALDLSLVLLLSAHRSHQSYQQSRVIRHHSTRRGLMVQLALTEPEPTRSLEEDVNLRPHHVFPGLHPLLTKIWKIWFFSVILQSVKWEKSPRGCGKATKMQPVTIWQ